MTKFSTASALVLSGSQIKRVTRFSTNTSTLTYGKFSHIVTYINTPKHIREGNIESIIDIVDAQNFKRLELTSTASSSCEACNNFGCNPTKCLTYPCGCCC